MFFTCSPTELYGVYLEILFIRGIVVVAICKILSSKGTDEEKESGLVIDMFSPSGNAVFHDRKLRIALKWNWDYQSNEPKSTHRGCGGADVRAGRGIFLMPGGVGLWPDGAALGAGGEAAEGRRPWQGRCLQCLWSGVRWASLFRWL